MAKYIEMPEEFFNWQIEERKRSLEVIKEGGMPRFFVHSPVMATAPPNCSHYEKGLNLACKGVGLVIKPPLMDDFVEGNEELIKKSLKDGWKNTLDERLDRLFDFYSHPERISRRELGSLEMYGTKTYSNLRKWLDHEIFCSLMYNDFSMERGIASYQVDCHVKMLSTESRFYRYVKSMHDLFHTPSKSDYFCAYLFKLEKFFDKSPKGAGKKIA